MGIHMRRFLAAILFWSLGSNPGHSAEITGAKLRDIGVGAYINIIGPIVRGDAERFKRVALNLIKGGLRVVRVRTYSQGGDVVEAIDIGRQIRLMRAQTDAPYRLPPMPNVYPDVNFCEFGMELEAHTKRFFYDTNRRMGNANCNCTSACFLIWAGGIGRYGQIIGVHRPAFVDQSWYGSLSNDQAQTAYDRIMLEGKKYLREMDIPENIVTLMFSVSSANMHYLSSTEVAQLQNYPQFGAELFVARCGGQPKYGTPQYKAWSDCFGRNDKAAEFYQGSDQYFRQYGNNN